jgi:translocation and assembly module TamA
MDVWPEQGVADVTLHFTSGPRYRLGEIHQNQAFMNPEIVLAYLDLEVGAYYDADDLARAYRDLSDSAYFGQIEILPDVANATDEHVPVQLLLQPGTHIEYNVGVGASTDLGLRFRAGFRNNRINQRGHRLIADLGVSTVLQGLTTEYRIPLSDPRREWFSVTGAFSNEETDTFDNEVQRLGVRWTKAMTDTWLRTLSLDANRESFIVADDIETSRSIVPAITFDQKRSDRDVFPRSGRRLGGELSGTDKAIGSTISYVQATAWLRWIRSFGDHTRLLARLNAGFTKSDDFSELPPSVRFFAGGDESVRGFDYESLGPTDADGNVVGGDNLLVASIEYERHLKGNFYGAMFVDAGNAFNNTDFKAEVGAGVGIKWRSPLGPIRLYLGYPVSQTDQSLRVHLRLGADL